MGLHPWPFWLLTLAPRLHPNQFTAFLLFLFPDIAFVGGRTTEFAAGLQIDSGGGVRIENPGSLHPADRRSHPADIRE